MALPNVSGYDTYVTWHAQVSGLSICYGDTKSFPNFCLCIIPAASITQACLDSLARK